MASLAGAAWAAPPASGCDGDIITSIEIRAHTAGSVGGGKDDVWQSTSAAFASRFATTKPSVVRAYLRLKVGQPCVEYERDRTERLLRAQPFLAQAFVRALSDGHGHTRLLIDVVDEYPLMADGSISRGKLASLMLGTQNLGGSGLTVSVRGIHGFAYRDGFGGALTLYGAFNGPNYITASGMRFPLGDAMSFEFGNPFLSELQHHAFVAGIREVTEYMPVRRPVGDDVSLRTHRASSALAWVRRFGNLDRRHTVGFAGLAGLGEVARMGADAQIVTDSGLVDVPDSMFVTPYPTFTVGRVAAIGGLRAIRFITVDGFDALTAQQDVGVGIQMHMLAGPSLWATHRDRDVFVSGDLYVGAGEPTSFASLHVVSEARRNYYLGRWDGMVFSARLSWYGRSQALSTHIASVSASAIRRLDFPAQLSFRDADGGLPAFPNSRDAGGGRVVLRLEERRLTRFFPGRADAAIAVFAAAGKLWAGDVPYGAISPVRASAGVSLLAAVPVGSKHTYRLDFAVPLTREPGGSRYEVRFTWIDRTRLLWIEPHDVARVRTGATPANLMQW